MKTRDGSAIRVRPIAAADAGLLEQAFGRLSAESRYRRFLSPVKALSRATLDRLTKIDHHDHEALIALDPDGRLVGVARFIRLEPGGSAAEVAVTVVDGWQGRGVATKLLELLVERAHEEAVERFTATCLATNRDMIDLLERLGHAREKGAASGVVELDIDLAPAGHPTPGLRHALRGAASGQLEQHQP